ncbi:Kexin [Penicillium ucsense]|uniref:Kexin n=1 Tax=Penicillium ucsense TaxID=2839758 RepID=A0A8J8VY43_9EURO|nr:Kexin [Penicillium ucsense]KAF7733245.1 Kexin [Penicillium ucsense]
MRVANSIAVAVSLIGAASAALYPRDYETRDYFALHLDETAPPSTVAQALGARHEGQIGELTGHHTFSLPREQSADADAVLVSLKQARKLRRRSGEGAGPRSGDPLEGILWSQKLDPPRQKLFKRASPAPQKGPAKQSARAKADVKQLAEQNKLMEALQITDPTFKDQWHLFNAAQPGHDLNLTGVWLEGITGQGVVTAMVDDGLDMYSNDLKPNYFAKGSWDYNDNGPEPRPRLSDDKHGTRCSGEIAAARNDVCGLGVAYDSKISGIRILSKPIDDSDEAAAINHAFQENHIYSCSWGPPDNGQTMEAPGLLIKRAMVHGVQQGRGGKGSVFVFAAGNGAIYGDNCNFDGYTNSIYSVTVGAIDREGKHPSYSESCSAQLVVAYSSGSGDNIHTTDVGVDNCFNYHGGTSAAAPLAAGTIALALSIRPELTWRDVQYLMVESAVPVNEDDGSWVDLPSGKKFSHDWGFGKIDAYALVQNAKRWELVKPQAWFNSPWLRVHHEIPQGAQGLLSRYTVTEDHLRGANFAKLEHVTVTMNINHTRRGDLSVELRSPKGIVSHLSVTRESDEEPQGYVDWTFMSVAHWGESPVGEWTVIVKDTNVNEHTGQFIDWRFNLWGEAIDGATQPLHPLPEETDDDHPYEEADVATTTVNAAPTKTDLPSNPDDQPDRPVKPKPAESSTTTLPVEQQSPTATSKSSASATPTSTSDHLSTYLPSFGASKRTQIWIYASLAMIIIFFIGLGVYFQLQRMKRRRTNMNDDYEFEMIEDEDEMHPMAASGGRSQRRGGELYNAFAGESDEEMFSDDDEGPYRDHLNQPAGHDRPSSPQDRLLSEKR